MKAASNKHIKDKAGDTLYSFVHQILLEIRDVDVYKRFIELYPNCKNPVNSQGKSLFRNILDEFGNLIKRKDQKHYIRVLALILEVDNEYDDNAEAIQEFIRENDLHGDMYRALIVFFKHYLKGNTIINARTTSKQPMPKAISNYPEGVKPQHYIGMPDITDLSDKKSFTIDDQNMAFTIEDIKDVKDRDKIIGTRVYVHVVDLSEYIDRNSEAYDYAKTTVFGRLFDENFVENNIVFKSGEKRFAITLEYTFDIYGKRKSVNLFNSIVSLTDENVNDEETINKIKDLFEIGEDKSIKREMTDEVNITMGNLLINSDQKPPLIYKNIRPTNEMERTLTNSDLAELIEENFKDYPTERDYLLEYCFKDTPPCVEYDEYPGGVFTKVEITDPAHSLPALLNQIMIKNMAMGKLTPERRAELKSFLSVAISVINAVNKRNGTKLEDLDTTRFERARRYGSKTSK